MLYEYIRDQTINAQTNKQKSAKPILNQFILNVKGRQMFPVCSPPNSENFSDSILMEFKIIRFRNGFCQYKLIR